MYFDIYVGVDGTGPDSNAEYATAFRNSYVNQLRNKSFGVSEYERGPTLTGSETGRLASWAAGRAEHHYRTNKIRGPNTPRIFMAGYSRGGAAVIEACQQMNDRGIPVQGPLLFDAVDRSYTVERTETVPSNVRYCRHAIRQANSGSRQSFGNCGLLAARGVDWVTPKEFLTTHGGMGGTPWGASAATAGGGRISEGDNSIRGVLRAVGNVPTPQAWIASRAASAVYEYAMATEVTPEQERRGSEGVWNWMMTELPRMRL